MHRLEARLQQHIAAQHAAKLAHHSASTQTPSPAIGHDVGVQCCEMPSPHPCTAPLDDSDEVDHLLCVLHQAS